MRTIDHADLAALSRVAADSPRLRRNLNLHGTLTDPVQRMLNAFEPGTYVRPHRHREPDRWELFLVLTGRAAVLVFDDAGVVTERIDLATANATIGVEIAAGTWHAVVALASGTVLFELKPGPYSPLTDKDFAAWAPQEGEPNAAVLERWYRHARVGDRAPGCRDD